MTNSQHAHLIELLGFLHDRNPQVRQIALHELLPYTAASNPARAIFIPRPSSGLVNKPEDVRVIADLKNLCEDQEITAHDALSALINLTDSPIVAKEVADPPFLRYLIGTIANPSAILADLCAMLLSNLSKLDSVLLSLLDVTASSSVAPPHLEKLGISGPQAGSERRGSALDALVEVFAKGEGKKLNKQANYDFLSSVFANLSSLPLGRAYLLGLPPFEKPVDKAPLAEIKAFTEHPSTIRRGGVASAIKNACFTKEAHPRLLDPSGSNILPYVLLPLCAGTPSLSDLHPSDELSLPSECQFLPPEKKREADRAIRGIFVEALLLLATTREGREDMRDKRVYRVVQMLHEQEPEEKIQEHVERLVNLLERPEGAETKIEDVPTGVTDDDMTLEEV